MTIASNAKQGITHIIHYKGKPVQSIKKAWGTTLHKAGITRRIQSYDLRHAFVTEALAAGKDVGAVAKITGHDPRVL